MAIRTAPPKELRFDTRIRELKLHKGGLRGYVIDRLERGEAVQDIAKDLSALTGESFSKWTLYEWVRNWKEEVAA